MGCVRRYGRPYFRDLREDLAAVRDGMSEAEEVPSDKADEN